MENRNPKRFFRPFFASGWEMRLVIRTISVFITALLLPGVKVDHFTTAILVSIGISVLNTTLRPIFILFTIPITVFSLGLFLFVINALMVLLVSSFVNGFEVAGFWPAMGFSMILTFLSSLLGGNIHIRIEK